MINDEAEDGHARVIIDGIDLLATATSTKADGRALLAEFPTLQVTNENMLEFSNGVVVLFDQFWQVPDATADVYGSGWIRHSRRLEDGANALVGLELLWNSLDHEGSGIERVHVLGGTEPNAAHADHGVPMDVDKGEDDKSNDIGHDHVSPEPDTSDISDGEEEEDVLRRALVHLGIVVEVDGNQNTAAEDGDGGEHPTEHSEKSKECDGIWADFVQKFWLLGVYEWGKPTEERV